MNPFFQAMQPKQPMNFWQRFQQFRNEMQGKDPNALIQEMMQSGKITKISTTRRDSRHNRLQTPFNLCLDFLTNYNYL